MDTSPNTTWQQPWWITSTSHSWSCHSHQRRERIEQTVLRGTLTYKPNPQWTSRASFPPAIYTQFFLLLQVATTVFFWFKGKFHYYSGSYTLRKDATIVGGFFILLLQITFVNVGYVLFADFKLAKLYNFSVNTNGWVCKKVQGLEYMRSYNGIHFISFHLFHFSGFTKHNKVTDTLIKVDN